MSFSFSHLIPGITTFNSSKLIIQFYESEEENPMKEILKNGWDSPEVQLYYHKLVNVAVRFGAEKKKAGKEMKAALELEIKLTNFSLPAEEKRNRSATFNPMPLSEVQKLFPEVPLVQYVKAIVGVDVTGEEVVNVQSPAFITKEISKIIVHHS